MKNVFVVAIIALLISLDAFADSSDIMHANNEMILSYTQTNMSYMETGNPSLGDTLSGELDSENGNLQGFTFESRSMNKDYVFLNVIFTHESGNTEYVGMTATGGTYGSVTQIDFQRVNDLDLNIGIAPIHTDSTMVSTFIDWDTRQWFRDVNQGEEYDISSIGIGVNVQYSPIRNWVFSTSAIYGNNQAGITALGQYGFTAQLGERPYHTFSVSADYKFGEIWHIKAEFDRTEYSFGKSDWARTPTPNVAAMEPDSTTRNITGKIGIGIEFE